MAGYTRLAGSDQSALHASLVSLGLRRRWFREALGWDYGARRHRYEAGVHSIGEDDDSSLRRVAEEWASAPDAPAAHVDRSTVAGNRLLEVAGSLAGRPEGSAEGFAALAEAVQRAVPAPATREHARAAIESRLTRALTDAGGSEAGARALLSRLAPPEESPATLELRGCYGVAVRFVENDRALDLIRTTAPAVALSRMEDELPELYALVRRHVDGYGWARSEGYRCRPRSPLEVVERIQAVLLRWKPETVRQAAEGPTAPSPEEVLGFPPTGSLGRDVDAYRALLSEPSPRFDLHRRALCIAEPFLSRVAAAAGCTPEQLPFCSVEEVTDALSGSRNLPLTEVDRRAENGFVVERDGDEVRVRSGETRVPERDGGAPVLTGMTASRGRAVGRVRVILAAPEVHKLAPGDVLVTATSTPDAIGGESVFPTRAGPPLGVQQAAAIVTDEGGFLSHAAILCREHGIPCIVGTERATTALRDGQVVEIDAMQAMGRIIPLAPS